MTERYRLSFPALTVFIFLLVIFFVPGGALDLLNAKAFLLVLGTVVVGALFGWDVWTHREIVWPKHRLLLAVAALPIVYLLSGLLSTTSSLALFGYNFEAGTFGALLFGSMLMGIGAVVFAGIPRALQGVIALFAALSVATLFSVVKIISGGDWFTFGTFSGLMGNMFGAWTDLAVASALLLTLAMLAIGMLPMRGLFKGLLYAAAFVSGGLTFVLSFRPAFMLLLATSVALFLYFAKIENNFYFQSKGEKDGRGVFSSRKTILPLIFGLLSILFLLNPTIGDRNLGSIVSAPFGISNTDIHPTLSTTLSISKAVLTKSVLFGSGPNTFEQDWLAYKPSDINATPFWAVAFPFGAGFIPTQVAATGIVGSLAWLAFYVFLIALALKVVTQIPEARAPRFVLVSSLLVSLFLWGAFLLYTPSATVFMLAFLATGILLSTALSAGVLPAYTLNLTSPSARFVSTLTILVAIVSLLSLGMVEVEKTLGVFHFNRANMLADMKEVPIDVVEAELDKAVKFSPLDTYFLAISNLNSYRARAIASSATGTPEELQSAFQVAIGKSVTAARAAVSTNSAAYGNWVALGTVYSSLVPKPLAVESAYENAQFAFDEAYKRNPANPDLPLLLAQLEINKENFDDARSYIRNSLALKPDYADAYLLLARLEASQNNIPAAIASAEQLAVLSPDNAGLHFEIGLLKYSNSDFTGAEVSFAKALTLEKEYANAKYYLALALGKLGRMDEARAKLNELLVANPDSEEVKQALSDLNAPAKKK